MEYKQRLYGCPVCGWQKEIGTNHTGEIYVECGNCRNSPLYFAEKDMNAGREYGLAVLHYYRYDLSDEVSDAPAYRELRARLKAQGFKVWKEPDRTPYKPGADVRAYERHNGATVRLYDPAQFDNQYVSNLGRLHQWKEATYLNKKIKEGYWLELHQDARPVLRRDYPTRIMYAITYLDKDGARTLFRPNQGRNHFETRELAEKWLEAVKTNNTSDSLAQVTHGKPESLEVRTVECYEHGDAVGIYFD